MTRRPAFRADRSAPATDYSRLRSVDGDWFEVLPPENPAEAAEAQIRLLQELAAVDVDALAQQLRELVAEHEPVELLSSVVWRAKSLFWSDGDTLDVGPERVTWQAKVEYLVGAALASEPGTGPTSTEVTDRACELVADIFDVMWARLMLADPDASTVEGAAIQEMQVLLRGEALVDRMPGFPVHLQRIDDELFGRHRALYTGVLGFDPAAVVRVVREWSAEQNRLGDEAYERFGLAADDPARDEAATSFATAMTASHIWAPEAVAAHTAIDPGELRAMLRFFATTWAAQPEFRLPSDRNLARTHPVIDLGTGEYFLPDPWAMPHALHERIAGVANADGRLRNYRRHRADALERLVGESLRRLFPGSVHLSQHYVSADGPGEVDVLVASAWPLIFEAKSHSLTPAGRRGYAERVDNVADSVVGTGAAQAARCASYVVVEGARCFAASEGGRAVELLPASVAGVTGIVVTFERMDPVAALAAAHLRLASRPWVVGIADFLMIIDLLGDGASFHHFARARAELAGLPVRTFMESDVLGAYLRDRLRGLRTQAIRNPDALVILSYTSSEINDHFTAMELGVSKPRPSHGVPAAVVESVASLMTSDPEHWLAAVDAVMDADAKLWTRWKRYQRRHPKGGRFTLDPRVSLIPGNPVGISLREQS